MNALPLHKRKYHAFLSHAHLDKGVIDQISDWLNTKAEIPVWYDALHLPSGTALGTKLATAIEQCRAMIIAVSHASIKSGWVEEEYNAALGQRTAFKDYRIIPLRLDDAEMPGFLQTTKWIELTNSQFDIRAANEILTALHGDEAGIDAEGSRDVYISASWRDDEKRLPDHVCRLLHARGLRLIGDAKDQAGFKGGDRVRSIIASCGALVAILPDRGNGATSPYMLKEIAIARELSLPFLVVAEPSVTVPELDNSGVVRLSIDDIGKGGPQEIELAQGLSRIEDEWREPPGPHYVFFATNFDGRYRARNLLFQQALQRITAMPCVIGDAILEGQIMQFIIEKIIKSFVVIADITRDDSEDSQEAGPKSKFNLNTCIEAGVAMGAKRNLHLLQRGPRGGYKPFLFRDQQLFDYADDLELLGKIHRIAYTYRRRVINAELGKAKP